MPYRTCLNEWSTLRRGHCLHNKHERRIFTPSSGFEHAIPAIERPHGHWDRLAAKSVPRKCIFHEILYIYIRVYVCVWGGGCIHTHTHTHTHTEPSLRPICVSEIVGVNKNDVKKLYSPQKWGITVTECSQPKSVKPKTWERELRIGVNWEGALKQKV